MGLFDIWKTQTDMKTNPGKGRNREDVSPTDLLKSLEIDDISSTFVVVIFGHSLAIVVGILEAIINYFERMTVEWNVFSLKVNFYFQKTRGFTQFITNSSLTMF